MRLGAIFVVLCMVLIAGSAGVTVYFGLGFALTDSVIVGLAVLTALGLYNTVSTRLGVRAVVGNQLTDLSRTNANLAHQVAEIARRLVALEGRMDGAVSRTKAATDPLAVEIGELGTLVKQLAETVAAHEARIAEVGRSTAVGTVEIASVPVPPPAAAVMPAPVPPPEVAAAPAPAEIFEPAAIAAPAVAAAEVKDRLAAIRSAIDANRIDLYLQPIVTLPQRKVRYYEAMSRLRTEAGDVIAAAEFVPQAEGGDLMPQIDNLVVFRCVQVVRRLLLKNRDVGLFCNLSGATLSEAAAFQQLLDFLDANRAIAPSLVLEFTQAAVRTAGPIENESLSALADRGFRFSLDNLQDLRIEPRELATRGFRFIKVPADMLLGRNQADIHPADLSDLLGRFGIDLIAEKIERETMVVDLLDYDVRFGQGFLFSPPRPVRAEALQGVAASGEVVAREAEVAEQAAEQALANETATEPAADRPRAGLAQLARNAAGRI
jgi:cyclic-di-GMP phosphodiesterase TipF (flagellum assembly factor)